MVNFSIKTDTANVEKMLNKYGQKAVKEYRTAIKNTSIYSLNTIKKNTPSRTSELRNKWKWAFKGELISGITNSSKYVDYVNSGWSRTKPILPINAKVLIFEVGKRKQAKSSTKTLYARYKAASKGMKGKGLKGLARSRAITQKSGVVVTKAVRTPASFRGYRFIEKAVNHIQTHFDKEMVSANKRIFAA